MFSVHCIDIDFITPETSKSSLKGFKLNIRKTNLDIDTSKDRFLIEDKDKVII